ncbi:urea ABC transporter ATP-binding subunit UrtE [Litoribrevibacter albus]|uniref:ABC transporter ATP-binding protein n=1 Tax=Litoribrevibacter albus TaxID=1473156 RepID=A0AA37SEL6_9GAMM|nr:urea ABC transporter ATP-binding subunit UrtE [Litoribrevibacter albus]GLQ32629.1 ABC transporter ATP-binding protein [Litoribrevibacter albus]
MLTVDNIDIFYGASQALKKVSLTAETGKVTTVLGRNGVGKTTLLKSITGHLSPQSGDISWDGKQLNKLGATDRAHMGIASVPQGREIFPQLTILENLQTGFACLPRSERHIPDHIFELFPVLKDMLKRRGGDLSGGQQQQLAIARALITRPKLLVLDEPTEGIQPSIIKDIQRVIAMLRDQGEMAIVLVEQYLDFAKELADDYLVMDRGEVVLSGKGEDMNEEEVRSFMMV